MKDAQFERKIIPSPTKFVFGLVQIIKWYRLFEYCRVATGLEVG